MTMVSRDPFARTELHHSQIPAGNDSCRWCGGVSKDRYGNRRLFKYSVESDGGRHDEVKGLFCGVDCMRAYHCY